MRRRPYSIVLLDEIEKAHPDVFNLLLQALDDGQLTDSLGRKVDFRNTIIIMTSNIGARQLAEFGTGVGFGTAAKQANVASDRDSVIQTALKRAFAPEFLNRIDDVILFQSLDRQHIHSIINIELDALKKRVVDLGYDLEITDSAADYIAEKGYDEKYGARPLKRAIQKYLEDPFAEEIINSEVSEGDLLRADLPIDATELSIEVIKGGLLQMPEGAEEALKGGEAQPAGDTPASEGKKKSKKTTKKKGGDKKDSPNVDSKS